MCDGDHSRMLNATMIVPIGTFTSDLSRRVRETAFESAQQREVIISMQSTERYSWSALYDLAESLHAAVTPYPIRLARALPRTRALLRELGIENAWFINDGDFTPGASIRIASCAPSTS
jgi:hypothetical protein